MPIVRGSVTPPQLLVPLRDIPTERSIALGPEFVREAIGALPMYQALERGPDDPDAGQVKAELQFFGDGDGNYFARGSIGGWLAAACGRCVDTARIELDEKLAVSFVPKEMVPDDDDEAEVAEDDEDLYPYDGETLDLTPLLREQVILAVPFAPLCKQDCLGLCQKCGENRNTDPCGCDQTVVDPRLAALKDLKI